MRMRVHNGSCWQQYVDKLNSQKLMNYIRELGNKEIPKKHYNMRVAAEEVWILHILIVGGLLTSVASALTSCLSFHTYRNLSNSADMRTMPLVLLVRFRTRPFVKTTHRLYSYMSFWCTSGMNAPLPIIITENITKLDVSDGCHLSLPATSCYGEDVVDLFLTHF